MTALLSMATFLAVFVLFFFRPVHGLAVLVAVWGTYPRMLALGAGDEGYAITPQRIAIVAALAALALRSFVNDRLLTRMIDALGERYHLALLAMLAAFAASLVAHAKFEIGEIAEFADMAFIFVLPSVFAYALAHHERSARLIAAAALAVLVCNLAIAVWEAQSGRALLDGYTVAFERGKRDESIAGFVRDDRYRAMGVFSNPLQLGLAGLLVPALYATLRSWRSRGAGRAASGAAYVCGVALAMLSGSRGAALLFAFAGAIAFAATRARLSVGVRRLGFVVMAALCLALGIAFVVLSTRGVIGTETEIRSVAFRLAQFPESWQAIQGNVLLGLGVSRNLVLEYDITTMDNMYLRVLVQAGVLGLAALLAAIALMALHAVRLVGRREPGGGHALFAVIVGAVAMLYIGNPFPYFYMACSFGFIAARAAPTGPRAAPAPHHRPTPRVPA